MAVDKTGPRYLVKNKSYHSISYVFSVQKNPDTKELSVLSSVFKVTAYVSMLQNVKCVYNIWAKLL